MADAVLLRQREAGEIAAPERPAVLSRQPPRHNGSDGVEDVPAREVVCRCDFSAAGRLVMPLCLHNVGTGKAQLHPGIGVDGVVDTAVIRAEAAEERAVCRVDDRVAPERGDVALPEADAGAHGRETADVRDAVPPRFLAQIRILHTEKRCIRGQGRAKVE